jgi:hypothetical protein
MCPRDFDPATLPRSVNLFDFARKILVYKA